MLTLRTLPVTDLKPAPYNPRVALRPGMPGYERLKRSMDEFDLVQPIVWNERTGHVVGGHQRLHVLKDQGVTEVEVAVVSLTPEREKALNVALNNPRVGGEWDMAKLIDLAAELDALPDLDATLTGFDAAELRDLVLLPVATSPDDMPDPASDDDRDQVRVVLAVPASDWDDLRPALDALVAEFRLTLHVTLPRHV